MSLAFLFPGQGSQQPGMLHALPASPAVDDVLTEAAGILVDIGVDVDLDTVAALGDTSDIQMALVVAGVACARALIGDYDLRPTFVAGHSAGAFAAAVTAGVLTLREALVAVRLRGDLMREACEGRVWGMGAVTGLPTNVAQRLAEQTATADDPLWVANVNSATQTVLSGTAVALAKAAEAANRLGARSFERLDVPVASHCPLQSGTAEKLTEHFADMPRRTPTARYLTNTRGRGVGTAELILDDLAVAVAHPVQWYDATRLMAELGVTCAVQTTPGRALAQLLAAAVPSVTSIALSDTGFDSASVTIRRESGAR